METEVLGAAQQMDFSLLALFARASLTVKLVLIVAFRRPTWCWPACRIDSCRWWRMPLPSICATRPCEAADGNRIAERAGGRVQPDSQGRREGMSQQNTQLNDSWTLYQRLREQTPLVQCITNYVAMNMTANVLLAAGASPAMVHCAEESGEFAALASALSINMGTPSPQWAEGMHAAIAGAQAAGVPWVLDPVDRKYF